MDRFFCVRSFAANSTRLRRFLVADLLGGRNLARNGHPPRGVSGSGSGAVGAGSADGGLGGPHIGTVKSALDWVQYAFGGGDAGALRGFARTSTRGLGDAGSDCGRCPSSPSPGIPEALRCGE